MTRLSRTATLACCVFALAGCSRSFGDVRPFAPMQPVQVVMAAQAEPTSGAIYRAGPGLNLYSDRRARDVGDLLTINLIENTNAQTSATTQVDKTSEVTMAAPNIAGAPLTYNGRDLLSASVKGDRGFNGNGKSAQSLSLIHI